MSELEETQTERTIVFCVRERMEADLRILLNRLPLNTPQTDRILCGALTAAANGDSPDLVRLLLEHGAGRVVDRTDVFGNTSLVLAAIRSNCDIIDMLLQAGCNVNSTDSESRMALHWIALSGNFNAAKLLLENGAVADHADETYNFTPLMLAARQGHTDTVRLLLQYNSDIHRTDLHGETSLFDAVRNNHQESAHLLLCAGARLEHRDRLNRTPLTTAILYNRPDNMRLLLHRNCSLAGSMDVALQECHQVPCELLVLAGASLSCLYAWYHSSLRDNERFDVHGQDVKVWITRVLRGQPRSLRELSRIAIRKFYEGNLSDVLHRLPVPEALQKFITIPELVESEHLQRLMSVTNVG